VRFNSAMGPTLGERESDIELPTVYLDVARILPRIIQEQVVQEYRLDVPNENSGSVSDVQISLHSSHSQ
jgi:hypothetical protein